MPRIPSAPMSAASSKGASIRPSVLRLRSRLGTIAIATSVSPVALCSRARGPGSSPSASASSREIEVRSDPVSTRKRNGPFPPSRTGTVIRWSSPS